MRNRFTIAFCCTAIFFLLGLIFSTRTAAAFDGPLLTTLDHMGVVDFGRRNISTVGQAEIVTFANSGTSDLHVTRVRIDGTNPNDFSTSADNCTGRSLTPGATCTVTRNFIPSAVGERGARLTVENDAPGGPHAMPLTGVGVDPARPYRDIGPIDLRHGFPLWYQDDAGVRLTLCLDANGLCIASLPDTTQQPSVADGGGSSSSNFPGEAFWWYAEANITRAGGGKALLVLSKEAAFATGDVPTFGQQVSFDRLRVRVDRLTPGRSYRVTHPFGTLNLVADSKGEINLTDDIGCKGAPCDFTAALKGRASMFLRWDPTVAPIAQPGYIGDPTTPHRIVGSPLGTNFFRVEGTNVGGQNVNVVETPLFVIAGKLFQ
jgi:hypothetical protein